MELYKEILAHAITHGNVRVTFENPGMDIAKIVEEKCYKALQKIKAIIEDDSLEDSECFMKIEEVVCTLEEIGSSGGSRHNFG